MYTYTIGDGMDRTQIYLTKEHKRLLKKERKDTGVNASEIIRRLLDKHFEEMDGKKNGAGKTS
jgi:predicted DNA-binding protein